MSIEKNARRRPNSGTPQVFAIPAGLLFVSFAGLVFGLAGDGRNNVIAWVLLCIPIIAAMRAFARHG